MSLIPVKSRRVVSCVMWNILIIGMAFGVPTSSFAQEGDEAKMQALGDAAMKKYQDRQFGDAAQGFEDAYAAYPQVVLLKNATVAWFSAGQCTKAERTAKTYLAQTMGDESLLKDRRDVNTVVARCRLSAAKIAFNNNDLEGARESLDGIERFSPEGKEADELIELRKDIASKQAELDAKKNQKDPDNGTKGGTTLTPTVMVAPPNKGLLYAGWGLVGVGATLGVASLVSNIQAKSCSNNADTKCGGETRENAYENYIVPRNTFSKVTGIGAGVIALTGGTLLTVYYINKKEHEKSITLLPEASPDRVGASVLIRF